MKRNGVHAICMCPGAHCRKERWWYAALLGRYRAGIVQPVRRGCVRHCTYIRPECR